MKILLALIASNIGKKPFCEFKSKYRNIQIPSVYSGSFAWYWIKALKQLGHAVETVSLYKTHIELEWSDLNRWYGFICRRLGGNFLIEKMASIKLEAKVAKFRPDIVLVDSGYTLRPEIIRKIKKQYSTIFITWLYDDPVNQGWQNVIKSFPFYDHIFTFDRYYVPKYLALGANRVSYLPLACDTDIFFRIDSIIHKSFDLSFVGTITQNRKAIIPMLSRFDLNIWTKSRNDLPEDFKGSKYFRGKAYGEKVNRIYNSTKIALNFHHPQSVCGTNMRTFEIASSGTFQLIDHKTNLADLFELGKEIISFSKIEELPGLIRFYLKHEKLRTAIGLNSLKRAQSEHTYLQRFNTMLSYL